MRPSSCSPLRPGVAGVIHESNQDSRMTLKRPGTIAIFRNRSEAEKRSEWGAQCALMLGERRPHGAGQRTQLIMNEPALFSREAWDRNAHTYEIIRTMPFNAELTAGTL